ncbi:MAG: 4Fe-4S binding protein, partial [Thermoplasmata archaeon]|nr:4Fe-4S binding protein [Thermoplasmata archaeon]
CELICSLRHWKIVNPSKSGIKVEKKSIVEDLPNVCTHGEDCSFECVDACKFDAMHIKDGVAVVDHDKCVGCGACVKACPIDAVWVFNKKAYKCDLCGGDPLCVKLCSWGALEFVKPELEVKK